MTDELRALAEAADRIVFVPRDRGNGGQPVILPSTFLALLDRLERGEGAMRTARFVAEHWRDSYMVEHKKGEQGYWAIGTHPLALVLAALDGETDPRQLGLPESVDEQFRAAVKQP